jgi:hypothetical protein
MSTNALVAIDRPRVIGQREQDIVLDVMREFSQMQWARSTTAGHWEEIAALILPSSRNTFFYQNYNTPGAKKTEQQVDASGMMALHRFGAICDSLLTPRNMKWHQLSANNDYVMKDRGTRLWFEQATDILFKYRYSPMANFASQNQSNYQSLGAFGTGGMFIDRLDSRWHNGIAGLRYKSIPLGELFLRENHQGIIDGFIRWFKLTAYQAVQKWGRDALPEGLKAPLEQGSEWRYNFLHCVKPRDDHDPDRLDVRALPFSSYYVSVEGQCLMQPEGGYRSFPIAAPRYDQAPGETYGRSPAMMVLPALKTLNAEKRTFLKQGHRAADPVLLVSDDGVVDMNLRPGAMNKGGVSSDGKPLVHVLPSGNIQISKEMMADEKSLINDAFLVTLFQILTETPQMTATEVIERTNEKGILLAPTIGRQQSEYLGPMIDRELDLLASMRGADGEPVLPPMPPRLREARGEYEVVYTSPLARAARAQEVAGFFRTVEFVRELVNVTGDPSLLDPLDFETAIPEIAEINAVPVRWTSDDDAIGAKRKMRANQQARQEQIAAAPAAAAMIKARAVAAKTGDITGTPGA